MSRARWLLLGLVALTGITLSSRLDRVPMVAGVPVAGRVAPERPSIADAPERHDDDEPPAQVADPDPTAALAVRHLEPVTARTRSIPRRRRRADARTTRRTTS